MMNVVGLSKPYKFPLNDSYVFGLMMYNNSEHASLNFKVYDVINNKYYDISNDLNFISDMSDWKWFKSISA